MSPTAEEYRTADCCNAVPRLELPSTYAPKGVDKETPAGLKYYETIPAEGVKHADIAVIIYYDVCPAYIDRVVFQG